MIKRNLPLLLVAALVGALWLYIHKDWFVQGRIQILHRMLPSRGRLGAKRSAHTGPILFFEFERKLKLTSIQVFAADDAATNKYPHALWHLVGGPKPVPTEGFVYGQEVPGMKEAAKGDFPEPLEPGVRYQLQIEAGSAKGEHEFVAPSPATVSER